MIIKAKQNATKKIKDRIKNHGPEFTMEIQPDLRNVGDFLKKNILVRGTRDVTWTGWFPLDEIEIINEG